MSLTVPNTGDKKEDLNLKWRQRFSIIPYKSSTCAKIARLFPDEPSVIVKGCGCRIYDANNKEYIDFRNSLGPVILGYQYPDVDRAIISQLQNGISFGHPNPLECEVAELICDMVPCAEKARFLKTGAEAVAACIRIARGYTGKDHVIQVGYNGWINSLSSDGAVLPGKKLNSVPIGVPECLSALHHGCDWNDTQNLETLFNRYQIAAVVIAADYANMEYGQPFYEKARQLCSRNNALLVYDEIVTGFRVSLGGIQEYFGIIPDMAAFAKGISNGMPLSVYTGLKDIMDFSEKNNILISSTLAGETLSLAAAKATLNTIREKHVIPHLWNQGRTMWAATNKLLVNYDIPISVKGLPACPAIVPAADAPDNIVNDFARNAFRNGLSLYNVLYTNFSHTDQDICDALVRMEKAIADLSKELHGR